MLDYDNSPNYQLVSWGKELIFQIWVSQGHLHSGWLLSHLQRQMFDSDTVDAGFEEASILLRQMGCFVMCVYSHSSGTDKKNEREFCLFPLPQAKVINFHRCLSTCWILWCEVITHQANIELIIKVSSHFALQDFVGITFLIFSLLWLTLYTLDSCLRPKWGLV